MTDEQRIDLRALDPDSDDSAADSFVDAVMARLSQRGAPAPLPVDPLFGVWSIMRSPALAAGIVIAVVVGALGWRITSESRTKPLTVAEALGVPTEFLPIASRDSR